MKLVTLDFETAYSKKDYSLSKMTTEEYINDPRFEVIGVSAKIDDGPAVWKTGDREYLKQQLGKPEWWADVGVICHNAIFDGAILAWKFGIVPRMYFDTLSMARPKHNANAGGSLKKLAEHYGIGAKGAEVGDADGLWLKDFPAAQLAQYGEYCKNDVELTYKLFQRLLEDGFPKNELRLIDRTIRMYTQPMLELDPRMIRMEIENEQARKDALMAKLDNIGIEQLGSNPKFAEVLRSLGVEPPMKLSAKKSARAGHDVYDYAFAKGDADFVALLNHDDPTVVAAVEARMGSKSTLRATRAQRFLGIATRMRKLPVPLGYYNAHTGRYGGLDGVNLQNLPRASKKDPASGLLRKAIVAPEGYVLVVCDLSQIEARLLVWMSGQQDKVEAFAQKRDVYSEQAAVIYGRPVDRRNNPGDFEAGFVGKCVTLGCGYGLGAPKFSSMIYVGMLGGNGVLFGDTHVDAIGVDVAQFNSVVRRRDTLDNYLSRKPTTLDDDTWLTHCAVGTKIIQTFRANNPKVVAFWDVAGNAIGAMLEGVEFEFGGPTGTLFKTVMQDKCPGILMPNGMVMRYEGLERDKDGEYSFLRKKEGRVQRVKLYGGALVENLCQALARIVITDAALRTEKRGYPMALQVHDEIVGVAPEAQGAVAYQVFLEEMTRPPKWGPGLPLDAEGGIGKRYGEVK